MPQNIYDNDTFFDSYRNLRETQSGLNECLEQPAFRSLVPPLTGKSVVDLGCGMGDNSAWCVQQGATRVTAVDISEKMLSVARRRNDLPEITYQLCSLETVDFPNDTFDAVLSALAFHYVECYDDLLRRTFRWLKSGGFIVVSMEHPIMTCNVDGPRWQLDNQGNKLHWVIDNMMEEGLRSNHWFVHNVETYHRSISTLMNGFIDAGFLIDRVLEPEASADELDKRPSLAEQSRRPCFLTIRARKPE